MARHIRDRPTLRAGAGDFRDWDREAWIKALDGNMLTPIELIKAVADGTAASRDA